jgi:hypothetical protein
MSSGTPDVAQLSACVEIFRWLNAQGRAAQARGDEPADVTDTRTHMQTTFGQIADARLGKLLDAKNVNLDLRTEAAGKWMWLPHIVGAPRIVPALTLRWDFRATPELHVFVALVVAQTTSALSSGPTATAYRFETGEAGTIHDLDHAQPLLSLSLKGQHLPGVRSPLHTSSPAFPLDATGPVGLTMCVVRSLYGNRRIRSMFVTDRSLAATVGPYLKQMPIYDQAGKAKA